MSRIKLCYKILLECYENCENNIIITSKSGEEMQMRPRKALDETGVKIKRRQVRRPSHTAYKKSLAELRYSESWERIHTFWDDKRIALCKKIRDSLGLWIPGNGFRTPGSGFLIFCQWNVVWIPIVIGLRILWAEFQITKPWILDQQAKISRIPDSFSKNLPDSGIHISLHGAERKSYKIDPLKYVM